MYYGRVEIGIVTPEPIDSQLPLSVNRILQANCSEATALVGRGLEDKVMTISFNAEDLENQRGFLLDVANWLNDNANI